MQQHYLVTNFAYGTGPYLRTTDLAIAVNNELERRGKPRLGIIIPWVYGEKQKSVMLEEFAAHEKKHPGELLLDAKLGAILKSIFYGDNTYEEALKKWSGSVKEVSQKSHTHLSGLISVETLRGEKKEIEGKKIILELNRSPRIRYDIAPSYFTSFAYIAEILEATQKEPSGTFRVKPELFAKGIEAANWVEKEHEAHYISYPATFSYNTSYHSRYKDEALVPPMGPVPKMSNDNIKSGIFVTITGIPGLERLYKDAERLGIKLYSNDVNAVPGSVHALPHSIPNKNILFQFARAGWSSIWLSMITGTPFVAPEFDPTDDPEIYFNNRAIESLGIGAIYQGEPLEAILEKREEIRKASANLVTAIKSRWGTLDGTTYVAKLIVEDFLEKQA